MADIRSDPRFAALVRLQRRSMSRRGFLGATGGAGALVALSACGSKGSKASSAAASAGGGSTGGASAAAASKSYTDYSSGEKVVDFANWPLYIDTADSNKNDHPTLDEFTKQTGIKVNYTEPINDNDQYFGKIKPQLSAGQPIGEDIIVLTDWMAGRLIRLGWVEKLDKGNIPNAGNIIESLSHPGFDSNRDFTLPWQSGMTGIAYNTKVAKPVTSIDQLLTDSSLKGKVTALTEMRDTMGLVLLSMGKDPANFTDADFSAAIDKLQKAVDSGQIRQFTGNEYADLLAKGTIAACIAWSGDVVQLQADNPNVKYQAPDSGAMIWADNMMIPNGARHKANAEKLMNFYYDPKVAAELADWVNYICPVQGAREAMQSIDKDAASNELIFPTQDTLAKTHIFKALTSDEETKYNQMFTKVTGA